MSDSSSSTSSNTYFVLPPRHRLFAIFDDPNAGREALQQLRTMGLADEDDVWTFYGDQGLRSLDPSMRHHGLPLEIVRIVQRVLTNDCEYCEDLAESLRDGAMVVAVKADGNAQEDVGHVLRSHGGHSLAYGAHWNFVPPAG